MKNVAARTLLWTFLCQREQRAARMCGAKAASAMDSMYFNAGNVKQQRTLIKVSIPKDDDGFMGRE